MASKAPKGWEKAFKAIDRPKKGTAWGASFGKHYKRLARAHPYADKKDVFMMAGTCADADKWRKESKKTFKKTWKTGSSKLKNKVFKTFK